MDPVPIVPPPDAGRSPLMPHAVVDRPARRPLPTWARLALISLFVGGGLSGMGTVLTALFGPEATGVANVLICVAFLALYGSVLVAGLVLVLKPGCTWPLMLLLLPQIPNWTSSASSYLFTSGPWVLLRMGHWQLYFGVQFGSQWQFTINRPVPFTVGMNVFAIALLFLLLGRELRYWMNHETSRP